MENQDLELEEYCPRACDGTHYTGKIILSMPTFEERMDILEKLGEIGLDEADLKGDDASLSLEQRREKMKKNLRTVKLLAALVRPHVHSVEIKRLSDGSEYSSFARLQKNPAFDADLALMVQAVAKEGLSEKKSSPSANA